MHFWHLFYTCRSYLNSITWEYWKRKKAKRFIFVLLFFVPVKWSRSWMKRVTNATSFPSSRSSMSTAVFAAVPLSPFLSTASDSAKIASTTSARAAALTRRRRRLGFAVSASKQGRDLLFNSLYKAAVAWPMLFVSRGHKVPVYDEVDLSLRRDVPVFLGVNLF